METRGLLETFCEKICKGLIDAGTALLDVLDEDSKFRAVLVYKQAQEAKETLGISPEELVEFGDLYLRARFPVLANEAYKEAGEAVPKEKFVAVGDLFVEKKLPTPAFEAYKEAGEAVPKEKFVAVGDLYVEKKLLKAAFEAYKEAGEATPTRKLVALGNKLAISDDFHGIENAKKSYQMAGETIPPKRFIAFGDYLLKRGEYVLALMAYKEAGEAVPPGKFIALGDRAIEDKAPNLAIEPFRVAGAVDKLVRLGDSLCNQGGYENLEWAFESYEAAGEAVPPEKFIALGDLLSEAYYLHYPYHFPPMIDYAIKAYKAAGGETPKEKYVALGNLWREIGATWHADAAYYEAGKVVPRE